MNLKELQEKNIQQSLKDLEKATTEDQFLIQAIHSYDEITATINKCTAVLKERLSYTAPEKAKFLPAKETVEFAHHPKQEDIGFKLPQLEEEQIKNIAQTTEEIYLLRDKEEEYIKKIVQKICPKTAEKATPLIASRLIAIAGSLKDLARMPSSTIQVLGAEKALFRHLRTGAKAPKFGVIFMHEEVAQAPHKAKAARKLASEIAKAAREDYFGRKN